MTNEEAKMFLDNLKICIDEHPIVADWLVEIADRKTESNSEKPNNSTISKMEQVDKDINVRSKEPQTVVRLKHFKCPKCGRSDYIRSFEDWGIDGGIYKYKCINCNTYIKTEPQTCNDCDQQRCETCVTEIGKDEPQTERSNDAE